MKNKIIQFLYDTLFHSLVYNQILEDPETDLKALQIEPTSQIFAICSGGCNLLNYLLVNPAKIYGVDLNPAQIALCRLKIGALNYLPSYEDFYRFFGEAKNSLNVHNYHAHIKMHLDPDTRSYWESRPFLMRRPRIYFFETNFYKKGSFSYISRLARRLYSFFGIDMKTAFALNSVDALNRYYQTAMVTKLNSKILRWIMTHPLGWFLIGAPPLQIEEFLKEADNECPGDGLLALIFFRFKNLFSRNIERKDNYFAWQYVHEQYDHKNKIAIPEYLKMDSFDLLKKRLDRLEIFNTSSTDFLAHMPSQSLDRYTLLDSQDWMNSSQLNALWKEINRTSKPNSRVIFRTIGKQSILNTRLNPELIESWKYLKELSENLYQNDRMPIYGGFHVYEKLS
jgi:S-adenosylmethionine-diacylglycerol 3-amino-3-carboxypropyl transferase